MGEASPEFAIDSGHNLTDPLRLYFEAAALEYQQDPGVQARCHEVFTRAVNLCLRFGNEYMLDSEDSAVVFCTPAVKYRIGDRKDSSAGGLVWLETYISYGDEDSLSLNYAGAQCSLCYCASDEPVEAGKTLMQLEPTSLTYNTPAGSRAGQHAQLNYYAGIIDKIHDAVFPRSPAEAEERRRREASRTSVALGATANTGATKSVVEVEIDNRGGYL